jgi:hypothetical protein
MALLRYVKPQNLNSPDDTYTGYTPPPIIQQQDDDPGFTANGVTEAALRQGAADVAHFSNYQPRTDEGQFNGAPVYPAVDDTPKQPASVATTPATVDDIWNMGAPGAQGIDPTVSANLQRDPGQRSASILLANAARRQPMDETLPNGNPALDPTGQYSLKPGPASTPAIAVVDPGAGGGEPVGVVGDGPPPNLTDEQGRPIPNKTIKDPLERYTEYQQRLNDWEPPKAHGWRRYVGPILQGWAAGQRGSRSPWSGLGGAITGAITGQVAPKLTNEQWKTSQQKETQDAIDQQIEQQKNIAGVAHTKAETAKLGAPVVRPKRIVKDKDGVYRPIDAITGLGDDGKPVTGTMAAGGATGFKGWVHDADGVAHYYEKGVDTGKTDPGRNKVKLADGRLVDPSQSYTAELTAGREGLADARANEANEQENARIQSNIASVQSEQHKVEDALKNTAPMITKTRANPVTGLEEKYQDRNPIYVDLENRRDRLIDNARTLNGQLKPIVAPRPGSVSPGFATPPMTYSEKQVRDRWAATPANKRVHKTADDAVAAARAGGLIPK